VVIFTLSSLAEAALRWPSPRAASSGLLTITSLTTLDRRSHATPEPFGARAETVTLTVKLPGSYAVSWEDAPTYWLSVFG
jgi:hypothetical protein